MHFDSRTIHNFVNFLSRMTRLIVKNVNGTSNPRYSNSGSKRGGKSWLDTYRRETKSARTICAVFRCGKKATAGSHVRCVNCITDDWGIVPFCAKHNNCANEEEMELKSNVKLHHLA